MSPHKYSTANLLLQGNSNPRTIFKTRLFRQNPFSLAKSLGRDEMPRDGALPQGGRKGEPFPSTYCFPLTHGSNKRKGLNFQTRKQSKGIFRAQDTKVTEDACDTEPEVLHHNTEDAVTIEPEVLHHNREDAVTLELDVLQATQT